MNILLGVVIGLIVLTLLVLAHELGHFIAARRAGVEVTEFAIGFPPRAIAWTIQTKIQPNGKKSYVWAKLPRCNWQKEQKHLVFSINWLPLGGFCAMKGENDDNQEKHTFGAASFWQKTKILFAGVAMNWLVAFIVLTILALTGMPKIIDNQFFLKNDLSIQAAPAKVVNVIPDSPAAKAGLLPGDKIVKLGFQTITSPQDILDYNATRAGKDVTITALRDQTEFMSVVTLNPATEKYLLGVSTVPSGQTIYRATWSAPIVGAVSTLQLTGETFKTFGDLLWKLGSGLARQISFDGQTRQAGWGDIKTVGDSVSGPIGILGIIFPAFTQAGLTNLALLAAILSISLACMNVLPIPALDGGRWLLITIFRLRKKPLTKEKENQIVGRSFIFLLGLIAIITILDIAKIL